MKLILIGGFLGSGKTTAIQHACMQLMHDDVKVAVVTNDQGTQLVDTGYIKGYDIPAMEVINGCFCCNFNELDQCLQSLTGRHRPAFLFAESVGSCTDLISTVAHPLLRFYPSLKILICIFADASLLLQKMNHSLKMDESVDYIYQQQLSEADILILNKADLLQPSQLNALSNYVMQCYPGKTILHQNSLDKNDIQQWIKLIRADSSPMKRQSLDMDYSLYAEGEARLAWLDQTLEIQSTQNNANEIAANLIKTIHAKLKALDLYIAHLKFLLDDGKQRWKLSYTHAISSDLTELRSTAASSISMLVNARVQCDPGLLSQVVRESIAEITTRGDNMIIEKQFSAFKPGMPRPTYRILN